METLGDFEEYLARKGFHITSVDAQETIHIHGQPDRDNEGRLWMWYRHISIPDLEVGIHDDPEGKPQIKIKDRGLSRPAASEFSFEDFPFFALMLTDLLEVYAKSE